MESRLERPSFRYPFRAQAIRDKPLLAMKMVWTALFLTRVESESSELCMARTAFAWLGFAMV